MVSGGSHSSGERGTLAFVVTFCDYPTGTLSGTPLNALDRIESNLSTAGSVVFAADLSVNGRPGRKFQSTTNGTNARVIVCIDGDRVWFVETDYAKAEGNSPDIDRFLDSFTLP
jgi:hypothetical protein